MENIGFGIYRYNGELVNPRESPLILVHPWYDDFMISKSDKRPSSILTLLYKRKYLRNIDNLLKKSQNRNIILFEEKPNKRIENSFKKIKRLAGGSGLYAVRTIERGCIPDNVADSWDETIELIRTFSNTLDLAGGYLWKDYSKFSGCLGETYNQLKKNDFNLNFVKGCCFTS